MAVKDEELAKSGIDAVDVRSAEAVQRLLEHAVADIDHGPAFILGVLQFAMRIVVTHWWHPSPEACKSGVDWMFDAYAHDRWPEWPDPWADEERLAKLEAQFKDSAH